MASSVICGGRVIRGERTASALGIELIGVSLEAKRDNAEAELLLKRLIRSHYIEPVNIATESVRS